MGFRTVIERFTDGSGLDRNHLVASYDLEPEKLAMQVAELIFKEQNLLR